MMPSFERILYCIPLLQSLYGWRPPTVPGISKYEPVPKKFLGIIGPGITPDEAKKLPLTDFLMSPGVLQGVFIRPNRTVSPLIQLPVGSPKNQANTALVQFGRGIYALYERGVPKQLDFDWTAESVSVGSEVDKAGLVSGHSKPLGQGLVSLRYSMLGSKVVIEVFDKEWNKVKVKEVPIPVMIKGWKSWIRGPWLLPIVHDFMVVKDRYIIFSCSPFEPTWGASLQLAKTGGVRFYKVDLESGAVEEWHDAVSTYYIFHYGEPQEVRGNIQVEASMYETMSFGSKAKELRGKWRQLTLLASGGLVSHGWNPELEDMNLDFPVIGGGVQCLRRVSEEVMDELVFVQGLRVVGRKRFPGRFLCSEPVWDESKSIWMGLSWSLDNGPDVSKGGSNHRCYLWKLAWPLLALKEEELETEGKPVYLGFHSRLLEDNILL